MLNKKIGLAALVLTLGASSAFAAPKNKWYVGADVQGNKMNLTKNMERVTTNGTSFKDSLAGVSVLGGYRWDCLGAELGFTWMSKVNYNTTIKSGSVTVAKGSLSQKNYNTYIDGAYYYPLMSNLDVKAILGVGYLTTKLSGSPKINSNGVVSTGNGSENFGKVGIRAGLGLQYYFSDCVSANVSYKYQSGNKFYKNMNTYALGVAYHF